jgi:hypothetical protein
MFGGTKVSPKRIYQEFQRAMFMVRRSGDGVGPDDRDIVTQEEVNYNGQRVVEFSRLLERVLNWIRTDDLERRRPPEAQDARKRFWYSRLVGPNEVRSFGDARVYCLGPTSDMVERYETSLGMGLMVNNPFRRQTTDERSPTGEPETNSLSIVIGIEFGGTVLILGGDAGRRQWKGIFAALEDKDRSYPVEGQFVKASHHGSRFACDPEVLGRLVGRNCTVAISADCSTNSFGHPHKETLEALRRLHRSRGIRVYCTNRSESCGAGETKRFVERSRRSHGYEIFSREPAVAQSGNKCFGTCVFDVDHDGHVRLDNSESKPMGCWVRAPRRRTTIAGDTPPPET